MIRNLTGMMEVTQHVGKEQPNALFAANFV